MRRKESTQGGAFSGSIFSGRTPEKNVRSTPQGLAEKQQRDVALEYERAAL
jgi:hypothetical protein